MTRLNVNGGAIALGHSVGCTGAKLTATALAELRRRKGRYAIVSIESAAARRGRPVRSDLIAGLGLPQEVVKR